MRNRILLAIIVINIAITSLHYTDNALFVDMYPEPEWITTSGIFITWGIMTVIALISYGLYLQKNYWLSYLALIIYSTTGLSSPTHYFYGMMPEFSFKMHFLIWSDFIVGLLVIGFIIWSSLLKREWQDISY
jgi:hypothetical protein